MASASARTVSMKGGASLAEQQAPTLMSFVCVECGRPVARLFREYNKGSIRLGRCSYCCSVADKYVECEFVLIAIDLALHRIQAYRHLLFNRKPFSSHNFHGRLWQLGVAMAALDAHLRHTALSSEAAQTLPHPSLLSVDNGVGGGGGGAGGGGGGDPFWEAGALLLAAVVEHACFAVGTVAYAALRYRNGTRSRRGRKRNSGCDDDDDDDGSGSDRGQHHHHNHHHHPGEDSSSSPEHDEAFSPAAVSAVASPGPRPPAAKKMYMAVVYPLFFRLLAAFVMIWDKQVAILNTIELLVATMQFVALTAVIGGPAAVSGMGRGGVAAVAIVAGLASKMVARGVLCLCFGSDPRTLRML
ncbi:unnamed protein product [Laminaria digitata]